MQRQGRGDHGRLRDLPELRLFEVRLNGVRRRTFIVLFGVLALLSWASASSLAAEDETRNVYFSAPVEIAADGEVAVGELEGVAGILANAVRTQLANTDFSPAHHDGVAVASKMQLTGVALLVPVTPQEYELRLKYVSIFPSLMESRPPDYPISQLRVARNGIVELLVEVGPDGKVTDSRTILASHEDFEKAAVKVLEKWRFHPPVTGKSFEIRMPFWFHMIGKETQAEPPAFDCPIDAEMAHVVGQSGCMDMIETTGMRRRR